MVKFTQKLNWFKTLIFSLLLYATIMPVSPVRAQVTGLENWTVFIDQGHSQVENMGVFGYSEAEKVLRVGQALHDYLLLYTDIKAVHLARNNDQENVTLSARVDRANSLGVDFYLSIHSDAGPPEVNRTLMLYGGWNNNGVTIEKTPQGGAAFGALKNVHLPGAMRIPTTGNFADRVFLQGNIPTHANQFPFLFVNRVSQMASLLSEAGFHTNPTQNQRNMNAEWKKLEALAALWSILEFHNLQKPAIGVATGFIKDIETLKPLNGINVTIGNQTYITDSYESLFHRFTNDPSLLSNGFFFIENLEPLSTVNVVFSSDYFQPLDTSLVIASDPNGNIAQNLSFLDVFLTSTKAPVVESVVPTGQLAGLVPGTPVSIRFSRKMNQQSVIDAIEITPNADLSFSWSNEFTLVVNTSQLNYVTNYELRIDGSIAKGLLTGQFLDGDNNGLEGGDFVLSLTTSELDNTPPLLVDFWPTENEPARVLRPIISLVYNEPILDAGIGTQTITLAPANGGAPVPGVIRHSIVNGQSVLHFFPTQDLNPSLVYKAQIAAGMSDAFNNLTEAFTINFYLIEQAITQQTIIDSFDAGIVNWWHPQQAGQTAGIVTELTGRFHNINTVNHTTGSTGSMRLDYAWIEGFAETPYIRQHIPTTASQNTIRFNATDVLQVFVFGDGSGNEFRLMIRDGLNQLEASAWIPINWVGWRLISWDLANDPVFGWVNGNGILDGQNFFMDGFHLRHVMGANLLGSIFFDDLRHVKRSNPNFPTTLFESFEEFENFSTYLIPWKTVDVHAEPTNYPVGFTFPGSGTPFAFKVLNPALTTEPIIDNYPPIDGNKYLIAMTNKASNGNKWLISRQIRATQNSMLRFFAKSKSSQWGLEQFRVLVIADNNQAFTFNPASFNLISQENHIEAPLEWTQFSYFLGNFAGQTIRFAIQYVSDEGYMLMLDKVELLQQTAVLASIKPVEDVSVAFGTSESAARSELQPSTTIFDSFGNSHLVALTWSIAGYNPMVAGNYTASGTFVLPAAVGQTSPETPLLVTATVTVRPDFTNISEPNATGLAIFPNPASSFITIVSDEIIKKAELYAMDGRRVYSHEPFDNQFGINIGRLESGIYLVRILGNSGWKQTRLQIIK